MRSFAVDYTAESLWQPDVQAAFLFDVFAAEGAFHQDQVGYNAQSGYTYGMLCLCFLLCFLFL